MAKYIFKTRESEPSRSAQRMGYGHDLRWGPWRSDEKFDDLDTALEHMRCRIGSGTRNTDFGIWYKGNRIALRGDGDEIILVMLTKGDIVDIYQKPITREDHEGKAKLVKFEGRYMMQETDYHFEEWQVEFIDEPGAKYCRRIRVDH